MSKWKKRILIAVGILLVVAIISIPTVLLLIRMSSEGEYEKEVRERELRLTFVQRYGLEARLVEIIEPEKLYIFIWDEAGENKVIRHYSLSIDGLFVELGQTLIEEGG